MESGTGLSSVKSSVVTGNSDEFDCSMLLNCLLNGTRKLVVKLTHTTRNGNHTLRSASKWKWWMPWKENGNCFTSGKNKMGFVPSANRKSRNKQDGTYITLCGVYMEAGIPSITVHCYIPTVTDKFIAKDWRLRNCVLYRALERLERCAGKLARPVLRRGEDGNIFLLSDEVFVAPCRRCFWIIWF